MCKKTLLFLCIVTVQWLVGCATKPPSNVEVRQPDVAVVLPFTGGSMHVLADDMDGNGLTDLAFTAHGGNATQVMYQQTPRRFEAGPRVEAVGFHPNDMIRLPWPDRRLYLSNAEGSSRLLVLEQGPDRQLVKVSQRRQRYPRATTPFHWPGWGLGLAVAPKTGSVVTLLKGFDPDTGEVQGQIDLDLGSSNWDAMEVVVADIDGDGIQELLFCTFVTHRLWVIRYPGEDGDPVPEVLWNFPPGHLYYVVPADVNGDGAPDLLVGYQTKPVINVLLNDGHGNFTLQELAFPGPGGIQRLVTAVDQDGVRYLFAVGHMHLALYRFAGGWEAGPEVLGVPLQWTQGLHSAAMTDIDGDGWLDVVVARARHDYSSLLVYGPLWENFGRLDGQWPMEQR